MKYVAIALLLIKTTQSFLISQKEPPDVKVTSSGITQWLDHFDFNNTKIWLMQFLENSEYFQPNGPIVLLLGGDWPITPLDISEGQHITDVTKALGGVLFYLEHRFYGASHPTESTTIENLQYLSADQALADIVGFIRTIKRQRIELLDSEVVVAGTAYGGTLAAWLRQTYPTFVKGAWASSASLQAMVNFDEFNEAMSQAIKQLGGNQCEAKVQEAFEQMEVMIKAGNVERLTGELWLCNPVNVTNEEDVWSLFAALLIDMGYFVQNHTDQGIQVACATLLDERHEDALAAYGAWFRRHLRECLEFEYEPLVQFLKQSSWDNTANLRLRQWTYQQCSEFGWFQTNEGPTQPYGTFVTIDQWYKVCSDVFGERFSNLYVDQKIARTNIIYSSLDFKGSNVYFTYGEIDPWRPVGLQTAPSGCSLEVIPWTSRSADMGSITKSEIPELTEAKLKVIELMKKWLRQ